MSVCNRSVPSTHLAMFAGSLAHFAETATLGHLIDRLMVQQQAFLENRSIRESFKSIYRVEGKKGFYKGFKWSVFSSAIKGAGGWTLLNTCNKGLNFVFPHKDTNNPSHQFNIILATTTAIAEATLLLCPFERLKVVEMTTLTRIRTLKIACDGGLKFFYRGWSVMTVQKSLSWFSYLTFYQHHRRYLFNEGDNRPLTPKEKIALGFGTGCFIALFSTPLDLVKTQVQKHGSTNDQSIYFIAKSIFKEHGIQGCFKGLSLRVIRTGWSGAVITIILDHFNAFPQGMKL